jgi:predicted ArsR family transcriptional regulator
VARNANLGRHRALSDESRVALLRMLEAASGPLDVHALADGVGLHVNTVRWHLRILLDSQLVSEERVGSGGRGRPRSTFRLVDAPSGDRSGGFRLLAEVLIDAFGRGDHVRRVEQAGRVRGRTLVKPKPDGRRPTSKEAIAELVQLLDGFGFEPRLRREKGAQWIAMRPCPFGVAAAEHAAVVCPVHLGLMRGALDALGARVEAVALEPFVRPDLCIARLRPLEAGATVSK